MRIPTGGDCNLVRTLKSGRPFSLLSIGSIRAGVQIDLKLAGFAAAPTPGPISPKPRTEQACLPGLASPKYFHFQRQIAPPKFFQKSSCNPYCMSRVLIHTESIDIQTSQNMKAILIETTLVSTAILFWTVALPAAVVLLPAVALWEKIGALMPGGPIGPVRPENPQDPARIPLEQAWSNVQADVTPA